MRIQRVVGSEIHPCKCIVGIYETFSGEIVRVVDVVGDQSCGHQLGQHLEPPDDREVPRSARRAARVTKWL